MVKNIEQKKIEPKTKSRCIGLDVLKCVAAFVVVVLHYPFTGELIRYFTGWGRFCVPAFLMITGFFYASTVKRNKEIASIKKILFLVVSSNLLFFVYNMGMAFLKGNLTTYLKGLLNIDKLVEFLFFNESPFAGHLWYLNAILYTLIIMYFANKFNLLRFLNYLIPVLLCVDLVFGKYSMLILGREFPYLYVRNFLFVGLPYVLLGNLINKHYDKLNKMFSKSTLIILAVVFSVTATLERFIIISLDANVTREHFLSTTFFTIAVFLLALKFYSSEKVPGAVNLLATIGQRYSAWIYIIHPIVITLFNIVFGPIIAKVSFVQYIIPALVFVATCVIIYLFNKCYAFMMGKLPIKKKAN